MAHERFTGQPLPTHSTPFDGTMYDLGWNGLRQGIVPDTTLLPSSDHALYLISAVKFHCGQHFHLFDEASFMQQFSEFQEGPMDASSTQSLWYLHFLLILAFGKAFVARNNHGRKPPGADFFVQAMRLMPDITYLCTQPVEAVEIFCCAALYLQCLDFRSPAYNHVCHLGPTTQFRCRY